MTDRQIAEYLDWGDQGEKEQAGWFSANGTLATPREYEIYRAGYRAAWGQARTTLSLHGLLK